MPRFSDHPLVRKLNVTPRAKIVVDRESRHPWVRLPKGETNEGFVYFLYAANGDLLYVGKAITPQYRVPQHRNKEWWSSVKYVAVIGFRESGRWQRDRELAWLEAIAIRHFQPLHNIAMPSRSILREADSALV